MVLETKTIEKIKSLVYQKPRSINDLANALGKNWRTANRYVEEIMLKTGIIKTRTFREGTRGALKIVYWNNTEKIYSTDVQEKLFKQIEAAISKSDFSPFEIYQYVDADMRYSYFEKIEDEKNYNYNIQTLAPHFESAEKSVSIFAGNLAFIHLKHKKKQILDYIKDCVKRKVVIKIITNINIVDLKNVEEVLSLNVGLKEPLVEIRHNISPLRAYVFDDHIIKLGEVVVGQQKSGQLKSKLAVYYEIRDPAWIEWMQKLFWKKFQNSIMSSMRIENLNTIRRL
ncbi:hypothetical protein ACFL0V_06510 [Nanoarchaeota archaeon]